MFFAGVIRDDTTNNMAVVAINSTTVRVSSGYALFEDGAKVKVDSDGMTIVKETEGRHYIYCERTVTGADFHAETSVPTDGDYVLLAEVTGTTVMDQREYSSFKVIRGLEEKIFQACPPGAVMHFARSTPPAGWLVCNGATISRTTYSDLFAAIGTTYGAGNGSTTFKLPDLRGEFIRGFDAGRGVDLGRTFGSFQEGTKAGEPFSDNGTGRTHFTDYDNASGGSVSGRGGYSGSVTFNYNIGIRPRNVALIPIIRI